MAGTEAGVQSGLGHTDADLVALTGVHDALKAVDPGVELTLEDGLEVGLHVLAADAGDVAQLDGGAGLELVEILAEDGDLVILDVAHVLAGDQLEAVGAGAVGFAVHIAAADDLALERGVEGDGDIHLGDLDLDIAGLEGGLDPVFGLGIDNQALGDLPGVFGLVGDDREAQADGAGAAGQGVVVDRGVGVDESADTIQSVGVHAPVVARLDVAEDHGSAHDQVDDVGDAPDVGADVDDTDVEAAVDAHTLGLVDDAADQEHENTAALIALDHVAGFLIGGSGPDHDHEAGDVFGNQRQTQGTHFGVGHGAMVLVAVGLGVVDILYDLDDLGAHGGGQAGTEHAVDAQLFGQPFLAQDLHGLLQVGESGDLDLKILPDDSAGIAGIGESDGVVGAELLHSRGQIGLSLGEHKLAAVMYAFD